MGIAARIACSFGMLVPCIALLALLPVVQPAWSSWSPVLGAVTACIAVGAGWALQRGIQRQLREVASAAARLAAGELGEPVEVRAHGELGELQRALHDLGERMFAIIARVRTGTATLASASGMMASDNSALSSRTEAQASALQQTASSVEELTATVRQNADNALQANAAMAAASASARRGGEVVANVVDSMAAIKERSRQISDITAVIDGIAFQTNILALNAAVEAARAGEEGRGFAVVAGEVRALAQRCAVAAKEIKSLILGTVQQVDAGSERAADAGRAMGEIVANVERIAGIMGEIAAASAEQSAGIEEVNRAVMQIDGMTQQNAGLVEDARRTAAGLQEQAEDLTDAVAGFRLGAREFGSAEDAVAMVREAVGFVQAHGREALVAEINKLGRGRFIDRDLYLSAYALDGRTVAHGTNRRLWNIDWTRFKDADGRLFIVDMVATAHAAGRGWIDYKWVHPVSHRTLVKSAYFEKSGDLVIACGVFKAQQEVAPAQPALAQAPQPPLKLLRA